jgi:hypothetical protein
MNSIDATDLLCKGFDLGSFYFGRTNAADRVGILKESANRQAQANAGSPGDDAWKVRNNQMLEGAQAKVSLVPQRWVRFNVLLGAKRHKHGDLADVVALVTHYLERGPEVWARSAPTDAKAFDPGHWWQLCRVAGFDLSGDEAVNNANVEAAIQRLFAACSSITIHAGEAMSAKSIWEAVYKLSAQRIGHGLRLRDDSRLLEYCVRNDICMELCPISNSFTNVFRPVERKELRNARGDTPQVRGNRGIHNREEFPLLEFLSAGLEVCLNTDNRSIHGQATTLTDEYLRAAVLCGGLTKWEVLRISKAGFKNAFLAKDDVAALLRHVEYQVYKQVSEHSGEKLFTEVESIPERDGEQKKSKSPSEAGRPEEEPKKSE